MEIRTVNPATGETIRTWKGHSKSDVESKLELASTRFREQRATSFAERAAWLRNAAEILERDARKLGAIMTEEMGKPITAAIAEAKKCAWVCRYYAEEAEGFLAERPVEAGEGRRASILFQPLGVVLAVMPWNFPFWQVFRFAAPAIMAGNVGLLKHASNVPGCAMAIEESLLEAGCPEGTFQSLLISPKEVEPLLRDPRVAAATLTGSEGAGRSVASIAGDEIKKTVLELGGSDPFVVMPSADLGKAVEAAVQARMVNSGQSCIAAKRFIVHEEIADEFERRFAKGIEALVVGDPMEDPTEIGPLANEQIVDDLEKQVKRTVEAGARVVTGGSRLDQKGFWFEPTLLADVPHDSAAACEETFGPVAALFRVANLDEAIALANDTSFGLGASGWSRDEREQRRMVDEIEAGQVFVNAMVASDPRLPFGGIRRSGYGRELGREGILEFVNVKTAVIA